VFGNCNKGTNSLEIYDIDSSIDWMMGSSKDSNVGFSLDRYIGSFGGSNVGSTRAYVIEIDSFRNSGKDNTT